MFSTVDSPALKQLKGNRIWTKAAIEIKLGKLFKSKLLQLTNGNEMAILHSQGPIEQHRKME